MRPTGLHWQARMILAAGGAILTLAVTVPPAAATPPPPGVETVTTCGLYVFSPYAMSGLSNWLYCPPGTNIPPGMTLIADQGKVPAGQRASWRADAPSGLMIVAATVAQGNMYAVNVNNGNSWGGGFYWQGGQASVNPTTTSYGVLGLWTHYFGFQLVCGWSTCNGGTRPGQLTVENINLYAQETQGPYLSSPSGLWQTSGWIRGGGWAVPVWGDSPSGLCTISASLNGQSISGGSSSSPQYQWFWHQCAAPPVNPTVSTGLYGQGAVPLTLSAADAAGLPVTYSKTVYIDNATPSVSISGPTDAPSTGGTQRLTATATAGLSGVSGISCSVDGSPYQWYPGSTAQLAVGGVGVHTARCAAYNNARDPAGNLAASTPATSTLTIRQTTAMAISFTKIVDALRCRRETERVQVPAKWVVVHRHHKLVRVHRRAHFTTIEVIRCHARVERRRVTVWTIVRRHGKKVRVKRTKTVRVVVLPHLVSKSTRRVAFGHRTTVSGWLGTTSLTALSGQPVEVLTAPDNGLDAFTAAAFTTTNGSGFWTAELPAGPSRLVEAYYAGSGLTEPTLSSAIHLLVPAKVKLISVSPRRLAWSTPGHAATVTIVGQLEGGYLPPGGALVRLRIGEGPAYTTYGIQEHVTGTGRFTTIYTFGDGDPSAIRRLWFQIASLPMGNYPYQPAESRKVFVTVGGNPNGGGAALPHRKHRHRHRRKRVTVQLEMLSAKDRGAPGPDAAPHRSGPVSI